MEIIRKVILIIAIIWPVWHMISIRRHVLRGEIVVPPFLTSTLIFSVFVLVVLIFEFSPFHLLWLFILSFILGFVLMIFPLVQRITIVFLAILATTGRRSNDRKKRKSKDSRR